jgi:ribonuclease HII
MKSFVPAPIDWRSFSVKDSDHTCSEHLVIGVDEVGRGCLAGPVYAAAVSFKSDILSDALSSQVTDSKLLSEKRREELAKEILARHRVGIAFATVEEIDELNILQASLLAMKRAVEKLEAKAAHLLIDGNQKIPRMPAKYQQTTIVKGDLRVALISAASIVAKVTRDQLMKDLSLQYPHYGFEAHKGYSTVIHKTRIAKHGPCIHHRKTFAGVKEHLAAL